MTEQFEQHLVEPNSSLGKALNYPLKRWDELTLFLRRAGAPLDKNLCEQALKMAILHRKGSMFYKTANGAAVGEIYMSIIHICRLCDVNPFEYLQALQQHAPAVIAEAEAAGVHATAGCAGAQTEAAPDRFHGVLAPNAKLRAQVVPQEPEPPVQAAPPAECEATCAHHRQCG